MPSPQKTESLRDLARWQDLYRRNRFLELYQATQEYWRATTAIDELSVEELIFGARLAHRLGGHKLGRFLFRHARRRDPNKPIVRYFTRDVVHPRRHTLDQLAEFEACPDLGGDDVALRASWFAVQATAWAELRDFTRAFQWIDRALALNPDDDWILSCQSAVLAQADRREEALATAERAHAIHVSFYSAAALGQSLLALGRIEEAAQRVGAAAGDGCESQEIASAAAWYACAYAELLEGPARNAQLARAEELVTAAERYAPLADRYVKTQFARMRVDLAELSNDHAAMDRWLREARAPYYGKILANLRERPGRKRILLPYRREVQTYMTCLPTSMSSALSAQGIELSSREMADDVTAGGTYGWAAADWLRGRGFATRFFQVTPDVAATLVRRGLSFVMSWEGDDFAHAVAVVGVDEGEGTLLIHDPGHFRMSACLLESLEDGQAPEGPRGLIAVPQEQRALLDELLPADAAASDLLEGRYKAMQLGGPSAARPITAEAVARFPQHPLTRLMQALQDDAEGRSGDALQGYQALLAEFPNCASIRAKLMSSCHATGNTTLVVQALRDVVERGVLPGVSAAQQWIYPPDRYVCEYADMLRQSKATRDEARSLLNGVLRRSPTSASAWHVLGDLLWDENNRELAATCYRLACCNAPNNEHYARTYCNTLATAGKEAEGFQYLEDRATQSATSPLAAPLWITWISALEDFGHPERAITACNCALDLYGDEVNLLQFAVPFFARMGDWERAESTLAHLESAGNAASFHFAASHFHGMRADLPAALEHAEAWLQESPQSMSARRRVLELILQRDGSKASVALKSKWLAEHPHHSEFEELFCSTEGDNVDLWRKYLLLRRRVRRNREDGWAWREMGLLMIGHFKTSTDRRRSRMREMIRRCLEECDRTSAGMGITIRLQAYWQTVQGEWQNALLLWLEAIEREPDNLWAYQEAWNCSSRGQRSDQEQAWQRMERALFTNAGHLWQAAELIDAYSARFGAEAAEQVLDRWRERRPDDPEILRAAAQMLLDRGQGRSDALRAVEMLEPAVRRFPYHLGLRTLLPPAYRVLERESDQEGVLFETLRRHPANVRVASAVINLHQHAGRFAEADALLKKALAFAPHDPGLWRIRVRMLMERELFQDARGAIEEGLRETPEGIAFRVEAVDFLLQLGAEDRAVEVAREGVRIYPDGAYLWLILGRTLKRAASEAAPGEIEKCLRRSVELNPSLYEPADWLAMLLVAQRRYDEAADVIRRTESREAHNSPLRGRLAWIARARGEKKQARDDLAEVVAGDPAYSWGWSVLLAWLEEDKAWEEVRRLLAEVPAPQRANLEFRTTRLKLLLEAGGMSAETVDREWNEILADFPRNEPLHIDRYDALKEARRRDEADTFLETIRKAFPKNPYLAARYADKLEKEKKYDELLECALEIWFAPAEESTWPATTARDACRRAGISRRLYDAARRRLTSGQAPTRTAVRMMASYAAEVDDPPVKRALRFGRPSGSEALALLNAIDGLADRSSGSRSEVLRELNSHQLHGVVVRYWKSHKEAIDSETDSWAQVGLALIRAKQKRQACELMSGWRRRKGVAMWMVTNYVVALPREKTGLLETVATCRDALATLPHDHCARFLVVARAEAQVLLGDTSGFLETWKSQRSYFEGQPGSQEFWPRKELLGDMFTLARLLEQGDTKQYRSKVRGMKWNRFWGRVERPSPSNATTGNWRLVFLAVWVLLLLLRACNKEL